MKWSPWQSTSGGEATRKLQVKVSRLELQGFDCESENAVAIEVKWRKDGYNGKPGLRLVPFYGRRSARSQRNFTPRRGFWGGRTVAWDDEFENLCDFPAFGSDWNLVFSLLYGGREESKRKMAVVGKVSTNLSGEGEMERKLPMAWKVGGGAGEATLSVRVTSVELRNSQLVSPGIVQDSTECDKDRLLSRLTYFRSFRKMASTEPPKASPEQTSSDTDDSAPPVLSASESIPGNPNPDTTTRNGDSETSSSLSPETQPETVANGGPSLWKRRRLGPWTSVATGEPLIKSASAVNDETGSLRPIFPVGPFLKDESREFSGGFGYPSEDYWDVKELVSKDGQSKLKTNFLFAPFDQRSRRAGGLTACTAISVVNAHWLHSNQDLIPSRSEFGSLIVQGSFEWQRLCAQEVYRRRFPDRHFDLETVIEANIRPLAVQPEKSFIGFFSPDKFECLKEAMSFDQIWDEMSNDTNGLEPRIYIVSWNDHFFVLKMEEDAYYIVDSLGSRLSEWCLMGYILKFDDSSVMYGKDEEVEGSEELVKPIFHGKECCREFIKRFLAAQTVEVLEEEDKLGMVSILTLYQRLQIEFHYTYTTLPLSPASSSDSSTLSLCSSEEFLQNLT